MSPEEVEMIARALRPRCVRWARRQVRDGAEDVAHAALEALVRHAPEVEAGVATLWLRQAVYFCGLQHLKTRRWEEVPIDEEGGGVHDAPDPESALGSAELAASVRDALGGVGSQRRAMVVAVMLDEERVVDAARAQGIPQGTARTRLHAGVDDLREEMVRRRVAEGRRSKGSTSWGLLLVSWDRGWRRALRAVVGWAPAAALALGMGAEPLPHVEAELVLDELPAHVFESEPLRVVTGLPRAERGGEPKSADEGGQPGPRRTHDARARMVRERVERGQR